MAYIDQIRAVRRRGGTPLAIAGLFLVAGGCGVDLAGGGDLNQESILTVVSPPSPAEAAAWAADPYDSDKRLRGMALLANAPFGGEAPYLRVYEQRLTDEDANVRATAVRAISLHGGPEHVPALIERLHDESTTVRQAAAYALQRLHNPVAVDPLLTATDPANEPDAAVRAAAAIALGQYAQPRVVQGLIAALRDRRLTVNHAARKSLQVLTGQDFGYRIAAWLEWSDQADDLFAGRGTYVYPVFRREPRLWELFLPWTAPPNEVAAHPAGMSPQNVKETAEAEASGRSGG